MKEANLAKSIDRAAAQKAKEVLSNVRDAIAKAVNPYWRPKETGTEFIGDDIRKLLRAMADESEWRSLRISPSAQMVNACRGAIINDLLSGLPRLRELAQMAEMPCPQCGTFPCHCETAEQN